MDATSEGKGSTTFPASTEDGEIIDVEKKVTLDGAAVVLEDEDGNFYQPVPASGKMKALDGNAVGMNAPSNVDGEVEVKVASDDSEAVKAAEEALSEDTGTRATLTASEVANLTTGAMPTDETDPSDLGLDNADFAPEAEAAAPADESVEATPAAEELAAEKGIDLSSVEGSGADGKVTKADVEAAADEA